MIKLREIRKSFDVGKQKLEVLKSIDLFIDSREQTFEKQEIETGLSDGINIEVIAGLNAEDKVKRL